MALAETLTYANVVEWLVAGTVDYCQNTTTAKYERLPGCIRTADWNKTANLYAGSVSGKHGSQKGLCKISISW